MKNPKTLLVALLILVTLGGLAVASVLLEKPWWLGPALVVALAAILVSGWLVFLGFRSAARWLWTLRPEKRDWAAKLSERWKEAERELSKSRLKDYGNPFYALPWYLMIGESGAGKSSALCRSGLRPQPGMSSPELEKTENCEWHFLEEAVVIDTAGRYTAHKDQKKDGAEWRVFLKLLFRRRSKEPLNGVIAVVAADVLADASKEEIEKTASGVGAALCDLRKKSKTNVPLYIMISKCDLIRGMESFAAALPEDKLSSAMGRLNHELESEPVGFALAALDSVVERLKSFRAAMSMDSLTPADAFFFSDELLKIKPGLEIFASKLFQKAPEESSLRGVFLTSALRGDPPLSRIASEFRTEGQVEAGKDRGGVFLRDLFSKTLPADRKLSRAFDKKSSWDKTSGYLWRVVAVLLAALTIFKLYQAYRDNLREISRGARDLGVYARLGESASANLSKLERLASVIENGPDKNAANFLDTAAKFALTQGQNKDHLKELYRRLFRVHVVSDLNKRAKDTLEIGKEKVSKELLGETSLNLARRVNQLDSLLEALESGEKFGLEEIMASRPDGAFMARRLEADPALAELVEKLYARWLLWEKRERLEMERRTALELFKDAAERSEPLEWPIILADLSAPDQKIELGDFWKGSGKADGGAFIPFSATANGKNWIDARLAELEKALPGSGILARRIENSKSRLRERFFQTWLDFVSGFEKGEKTLKTYAERERVVSLLGGDEDPYFLLAGALIQNASAFKEAKVEFPRWIQWTLRLEKVKENLKKNASLEKSNSLIYKTRLGRALKKVSSRDSLKESSKSLQIALKLMKQARREAMSSGPELTAKTFLKDKESAVLKTSLAFQKFEETMPEVGARSIEKIMEIFTRGRVGFLWMFLVHEAGRDLQGEWENRILPALYEKSLKELKDGDPVDAFIKGTAAPFIRLDLATGKFVPVKTLGLSVNFSPLFSKFLKKRRRFFKLLSRPVEIDVKFLPTEALGGKVYADSAHLEVSGGGSSWKIGNYQNVTKRKLTLDLFEQTSVLLRASVGGVTVSKKYEGENAFFRFFRDFKHGSRSFSRAAFPIQTRALKKLGVRKIRFNIEPDCERELKKAILAGPARPPKTITHKGDQGPRAAKRTRL